MEPARPTSGPHISPAAPWPDPPLSGLLTPAAQLLILTGAGVSAGCGIPAGAQLATWLRAQPFAEEVDFSVVDAGDHSGHPGRIASAIVAHEPSRRYAMTQAVAEFFADQQTGARLSQAMLAIARIPAGVVLTLNYDTLLEDAARVQGRTAHTLLVENTKDLIDNHLRAPDGDLRVMHLHGVVSEPRSLVLDDASYGDAANRAEVRDLLIALLSTHNLCAIGTEFAEDYLGALMLQRRPQRPRHVLVCNTTLASSVISDSGPLGVSRHGVIPCSFADGDYASLDGFCERLVAALESTEDGPTIPSDATVSDTVYARRRLIARDEVDARSDLSVEMQLLYGGLKSHDESTLAREQLALVIGVPGSGKTRLLQELAGRDHGLERSAVLRMRDIRQFVGEPALLLRSWLEDARVHQGGAVQVQDVIEGRVRLWLLIDGLDEAPRALSASLAAAVEVVANAFPQHRFLVTTRPLTPFAQLPVPWRTFELVCDEESRDAFLAANGVQADVLDAFGPAGGAIRDLMTIPFFLRAAVKLADETGLTSKLQIALALLDQALTSAPELTVLGNAPRRWLGRLALLQLLSGTTTTTDEDLIALAEHEPLGDPVAVADQLAGRSLLVPTTSLGWAFQHRLFAEALAAEQLIQEDPADWVEVIAPAAHGYSAVLAHWSTTVEMVVTGSQEWRSALAGRDPLFVARATNKDAPEEDRARAAAYLWHRASEFEIWLDPMRHRTDLPTDAEIIAELLGPGDVPLLQSCIRSAATNSESRFTRSNAIEVLSRVPGDGTPALFIHVLERDPDPVVRRAAASAAGRLKLVDVVEAIIARAKTPGDDTEAADMASVALRLVPAVLKLETAKELSMAENASIRGQLVLDGAPVADQIAWLTLCATDDLSARHSIERELNDLVSPIAAAGDDLLIDATVYLAAIVQSHDQAVVELVQNNPSAGARALVRAITDEAAYEFEIGLLLISAGVDALEAAGAAPDTLEIVRHWTNQQPSNTPPRPRSERTSVPIATILTMPEPQRHLALLRWQGSGGSQEPLTSQELDAIGEVIEICWADQDLPAAVRREGRSANISSWASFVLAWGPKCRFTLNDRRWAEIASCGWIYGPQHDWLIPQATQSRLDAATSRASNDLSVLADLLVVGVDLDTARVVAQLAGLDQSDEIDPPERERIGVSLQRAGNRAGLETLVASGEQWRTALRPYLAEVGSIDAQRQELQDLTRRLRDHVRPGDPSTLRWLAHITDVTLLPELEQALIAAGRDHRSDIVPDVTAPILRAITGLDPLQAIPVLDRLSRERPYPGAQFLIDERDRLVQSLLQTEGTIAAGQRAAALSLPWPAV